MRCPKCGEGELKEETYGWYKCNYCGNTFLKSAVKDCENCELKAQKEKAEAELKEIKERIEAVTEETIWNLIEKYGLGTKGTCMPCVYEYAKETVNFIKQIGGVK